MQVEREFLDAFSVIISPGYYIEEDDFAQLLLLLQVSDQSNHHVQRAKLLEFFTLAAQLLNFDTEKVNAILTEPWERDISPEPTVTDFNQTALR